MSKTELVGETNPCIQKIEPVASKSRVHFSQARQLDPALKAYELHKTASIQFKH